MCKDSKWLLLSDPTHLVPPFFQLTEEGNSFSFRNVGLISEHQTKDKTRNLLIFNVNIRCVFIPDVMRHAVAKLRNHLYVLRLKKRKLLL